MSGSPESDLDLRTPSGWFFALLGAILVFQGIVFPGERAPLTEANVNLYSGIGMAAFGAFLLVMARRARGRS